MGTARIDRSCRDALGRADERAFERRGTEVPVSVSAWSVGDERMRRDEFLPSQEWRARESWGWKRLMLTSYVILGLILAPMPFRERLTPTFLLIWCVPLVIALLLMFAWVGHHVFRQVRTGRQEVDAWRRDQADRA
jgi:hypothetical protein